MISKLGIGIEISIFGLATRFGKEFFIWYSRRLFTSRWECALSPDLHISKPLSSIKLGVGSKRVLIHKNEYQVDATKVIIRVSLFQTCYC